MVDTVVDLIRQEVLRLQIPDTIRDEFDYDLDSAECCILDWKKHLRTIHQDQAKKDILEKLTCNQAFIIMT